MAKIHTPIPSLKLNDGASVPMLAYGTGTAWYKNSDNEIDQKMVDATKLAISLGYYHLDGAEVYNTERELGIAIMESGVDRKELYVVTKVNKADDDLEASFEKSLKKLQLEYVDLYLIHNPFFAHQDEKNTPYGPINEAVLQSTWATMEKIKASGKAKSIGVSNYLPQHLEPLLKTAKVIPAINQIEFHPYLQHQSSDLIAFHKKHGIATSAYGPLTAATRAKGGPADELLAALAKKYAVSEGEVSLRWCIDQDIVAITTSSKEQRLSDYLRCTKFKLTPAEIKQLNEIGSTHHYRAFWPNKFKKEDTQ